MKKLILIFLVLPVLSFASTPPASGTFSNVKNSFVLGEPTLKTKMNLIVTTNKNGQQFIIQCFKGRIPGFSAITNYPTASYTVVIQAGENCPAKEAEVTLDYEEAIVRFGSGWVYLPRGNIYVPAQD